MIINKTKISITNIITMTAIIGYIAYSAMCLSMHIPFFDEINGWNIASNCNFFELLEVCKHEGHFILWYLLIKPFASNNIWFPYSMFLVNWIFAFAAVLVLWLKAPFNPLLKILITFSIPIKTFSLHARCYSIGVLLLFILCSMYKNRLKHPILYSCVIILLANTSVMGTISAFLFGLLYISDIVSEKIKNNLNSRNLYQVFGIYTLGVILVLCQIWNFTIPSYALCLQFKNENFFPFLLSGDIIHMT